MRLLLDTHVLLWALLDDPALAPGHKVALSTADVELHVSAATIWEIAIKRAQGKLVMPNTILDIAQQAGCRPLPISWTHAEEAGSLPRHHGDPFDRMLIAQARCEGLTIVTADRMFGHYDVDLL